MLNETTTLTYEQLLDFKSFIETLPIEIRVHIDPELGGLLEDLLVDRALGFDQLGTLEHNSFGESFINFAKDAWTLATTAINTALDALGIDTGPDREGTQRPSAYEANGDLFYDGGTPGYFHDDQWITDGQLREYGPNGRTVQQELQSLKNYDFWFGTNRAAEFPGVPDNDYGGRNAFERADDAIAASGGGVRGTVNAIGDVLGFDGSFGYDGAYEDNNRNGSRDGDKRESKTDRKNDRDNDRDDRRDRVDKEAIDRAVKEALKSAPILFDLDGDGVQITELSNSSVYMDATGDGFENRTSWAGAGDAVLFYDPDNLGEITEKRQYVFTEWDPTANSDMEALASVFDSNGDGVFDAQDDAWGDFKLLVTNADGSTTAKTLTELGIVSIDLTPDATNIELPDGSVITGQTTFTRDDGSTGTVADVTLIAEADGHRLEQVESFDANGTRTEVTTGYDADGSIAFVNTTVVSADGTQIANSYDDNGDGVVDRLQTIDTVTQPDGSQVKTVTNSLGAAAATAILLNQTVTTTSADGNTITIERDSTGGGWFDQTEVRVTATDGSMTIVTTDQGQDGTVIRSVGEAVSADGMTRTEAIDSDGDGAADVTMTHAIVVNPDGSRSETVTVLNQDGSVRSVVTETVSADGQTKTIARDVDGDGQVDTVEDTDITTGPTGSTSTMVVTNGDGSLRNATTYVQSEDALTKTSTSDLDGDGDIDVTTVDATVINPDGSRVQTITSTNNDGSIRGMQQTTLGADKVSSETYVDLNQNGVFEATDLVREVTVDGVTGDRTATTWDRNADGSVNATSTSVTSADGLTSTTATDADGDGDIDTNISDITVVNGAGEATRTITTTNQDGSLRSEAVAVTSADGLATTTTFDTDGDGSLDGTTEVHQTNNPDGTIVRESSTYAGDGVTLLSHSVSTESADRRIVTTETDANGDGHIDSRVVSTQAADGSRIIEETSLHADGSVAATQVTTLSANRLESSVATDADGDGMVETTTTSTTVLTADGGRTQTSEVRNNDGSLRSQSIGTNSDDGLTTTSQTDADGDGSFERENTATTTLHTDGSISTLAQTHAENGDLISQTLAETSDDGLIVTQSSDTDGDGTYDLISTTTTTLEVDGGTTTANEVRDAAGVLRSGSTTTASDDGRHVTRSVDINGDGNADQVSVTTEADDGRLSTTTSQYDVDGELQSRSRTDVREAGTKVTKLSDANGDGVYELKTLFVKTYLDDGRVRDVAVTYGADGTEISRSQTIASADGRDVIRTEDYNKDGVVDLTVSSETDLAANGIQTQTTTRSSADGSTIGTLQVQTSADGRTITTTNDTDGNGNDDLRSVTTLADDGTRTTNTEYLSTGGVVESSYRVITSADGLTTTRLTDRNADGEIDLRTVETSAIHADGTVTRSVEHRGQHHVLEGREEYVVSDDGMSSTMSLDLDGDGLFDYETDVETTYRGNGDIVRSETTRNEESDILGQVTSKTSGDGLTTETVTDYSGDGSFDRSTSIVRGPDGGFTSVTHHYGAGYDLQRTEIQTLSADERSSVTAIDRDGDGFVDQQVESVIDLSGNTTTTYKDIQINSVISDSVTGFTAANGMHTAYSFDVDGDGTTDITRTTDISYADNGNMVRTFTETFGAGTRGYQEVTTTAADALSSTSTFDMDGDGDIDGTTSSVTTLNTDGSRETITETYHADGELHSRVAETVSADGRITTREMDYDGNGIADKLSETVIASDGSRVETESAFNEAGIRNNTFITTTSVDGLTTTVLRQGNEQTTTRSVVDNGTYTWNNGIASNANGHRIAEHTVDALGVETWHLTWREDGVTNTSEVRLDAAAKDRLIDEAASIYDAVLDRGLDTVESEDLVRWVDDGQLDKSALIAELMGSGEYTVRYGEMSHAEFITQMYMNSFGRSPSMVELKDHLAPLASGTKSREEVALELADSVEHAVVGNTHLLTNNFDVIMNSAVFERSLDKAYIEAMVTNLVDVVYDRDPTTQELSYLSELLLEGDKLPDDIVGILMGVEGDIQGVSSASLHDLSGANLVTQAFQNALGRAPTQVELDLWVSNISGGLITAEQFVASLAQSTEHLETGNEHLVNAAPTVTTSTGTSGNDSITAGSGQDYILGLEGNDTLWGKAGSDIIVGGLGDDRYGGKEGSDTYIWKKGDGNDTIEDNGISWIDEDTLILEDVDASDVTLTRADGSTQLVITISATGETITVKDNFSNDNPGRGIERIIFSDNTEWHLQDIREQTKVFGTSGNNTVDGKNYDDNLFGLEGNDTLIGYAGDDVLDGGTGNDELNGGAGDDTYIWSRGDGADTIRETSNQSPERPSDVDTLVLVDVLSTEVTLVRDRSSSTAMDDLHLMVSDPSGDVKIDILDQFGAPGEGIEKIEFADGVVWTRQDIIERTTIDGNDSNNTITGLASDDNIYGHDGNDTLDAGAGNDVLIGGIGNDTLKGGDGGDTYVWSVGDGDDKINEKETSDLTQVDRLQFTDVNSADVQLWRENSSDGETRNDLYITINGTEIVEVFDQFSGNGEGIEQIVFADGVIWDREDVFSRTRLEGTNEDDVAETAIVATLYGIEMQLVGSSARDNICGLGGNDVLRGQGGDDWLYGGLDDDTLYGGTGNDTYVWQLGDGNDTIRDTSATDAETDTLRLTDVASDGAALSKSGDDLLVTIGSEVITVVDRFDVGTNGDGDGVEFITFSDGVFVEVLGGALAEVVTTGTDAADTLNGWGLEDTIYGLGGNDTLSGQGGDDTLIGGAGVDTLRGGSSSNQSSNGNDTYVWAMGDGNDIVEDRGWTATETDTLRLTDVASDGVSLHREEGQDDLIVTILQTGEQIKVLFQHHSSYDGHGIEAIAFADGVVWSHDEIYAQTIVSDDNGSGAVGGTRHTDVILGGDGNQILSGQGGDDTLIGGAGVDTLRGGSSSNQSSNGNDTYVWAMGDGNDIVEDRGWTATETDTLRLTDVASDGVSLHREEGQDDLIVTILQTGEQIKVLFQHHSSYDGHGIEAIAFADGVVWSHDEIYAQTTVSDNNGNGVVDGTRHKDVILGGDGDETLKGLTGNDYLYGEAGNDRLEGGDGSDHLFGGDGNDILTGGNGDDKIQGGAGDDYVYSGTGDDWVDGGDGVDTFDNSVFNTHTEVNLQTGVLYSSGSWGNSVEILLGIENYIGTQAGDNIYGSSADNMLDGQAGDDALEGLDGDDVLKGGDGADTLDGGLGDDRLVGGSGNDTYVYKRGYGADTISDSGSSARGNDPDSPGGDRIKFGEGIEVTDLILQVDGKALKIYVADGPSPSDSLPQTADVISIYNWSLSNGRVESLEFADGTLVDLTQISHDSFGADLIAPVTNPYQAPYQYIASYDDLIDAFGANASAGRNHYTDHGAAAGRYVTFDALSYIASYSGLMAAFGTDAELGARHYINHGRAEGREITFDADQYLANYAEVRALFGYDPEAATAHYIEVGRLQGHTSEAVEGALSGDAWHEFAVRDAIDDVMSGGNGADWIDGFIGNDTISGNGGDDVLFGRSGADAVTGGTGADIIIGGTDNDTLTGGTGADTFVFDLGDGLDTITDFEEGIDLISFKGTGLTFADLNILTRSDGLTIVGYGNSSIGLENTFGLIDESDFVFN
ncbi:calcium-binding protein [Cognatiyoonia sp. IB215446]|uniref:calcium-binding protein n=1 Tax=Cognatiyoonia sp. IB215446 TaxID=3097355 RepID=UPI002A0E1E93|nr:calcium-binding protein [Cognatiyoonia sp. IB215446]MDX8348802.1 calcium-binding protein [Cognatiyoonia sp. IB215446]